MYDKVSKFLQKKSVTLWLLHLQFWFFWDFITLVCIQVKGLLNVSGISNFYAEKYIRGSMEARDDAAKRWDTNNVPGFGEGLVLTLQAFSIQKL